MRPRPQSLAAWLAPLVLLLVSTPAWGCIVYRAPFASGADVLFQAAASSGRDCRVQVAAGTNFAIESNEIVARPHYGGVRVDGTDGAYYRSNPGYRGRDEFAFALCGHADGRSACSTVRVRVQVR